jgi:hypothetical protein
MFPRRFAIANKLLLIWHFAGSAGLTCMPGTAMMNAGCRHWFWGMKLLE